MQVINNDPCAGSPTLLWLLVPLDNLVSKLKIIPMTMLSVYFLIFNKLLKDDFTAKRHCEIRIFSLILQKKRGGLVYLEGGGGYHEIDGKNKIALKWSEL